MRYSNYLFSIEDHCELCEHFVKMNLSLPWTDQQVIWIVIWADLSMRDHITDWGEDSTERGVLPVRQAGGGSGHDVLRDAGHAHVVFALRAVAVVGVLCITWQLTQSVGVLGERRAVGLHPLSVLFSLITITDDVTLHNPHMTGDIW